MKIVPPPPATYTVIRSDDRHAVLVEHGSDIEVQVGAIAYLPISTLQVRLRPGDRLEAVVWHGTVHGEVARGSVPPHVVGAMAHWLARLAELGLPLRKSSDALAREFWESNNTMLKETLRSHVKCGLVGLPPGHPDLDLTAGDDVKSGARRLTEVMRPHVPDFDLTVVRLSETDGYFVVLPEAIHVPFGDYDYERPEEVWHPLVEAMNTQLASVGAQMRWLPVKDWGLHLVRPELGRLVETEL